MARPKKGIESLKAIRVNVRMTVNEYLIVSGSAATLGMGIPDYIRKKVTGRPLTRTKVTPEDRRLFVELSRIGNNINQLTKQAHLGIDNSIQLHGQLSELKHLLDSIKSHILKNDSGPGKR